MAGHFDPHLMSCPVDRPLSEGNGCRPIGSDCGGCRSGSARTIAPTISLSISLAFSLAIAIGISAFLPSGPAWAGLSSENVIVIVNGESTVSRTVANHYIDVRQIPSKNVIILSGVPRELQIDLDSFRDKILKPVLAEIDTRGISALARVIAYSADFPTAVKIPSHCAKLTDPMAKQYQLPTASITGLTYFYRYVLADDPSYLSFGANLYARGKFERHFLNPFAGDKKADFDAAVKLMDEQKYAESAVLWKKLADGFPNSMPGLAIRAAESYSLAEQGDQAVAMIRAALKAGWRSATYLNDTPSLQRWLDDPAIQSALPLLDHSPMVWQGPQAFSSSVGWTLNGSPAAIAEGGIPYLCSCSLAVVTTNGSMLGDAVRVLRRAAKSDRTFPSGRFAFGTSSDVRSKTRYPGVADAITYLQEEGFQTEVFSSVMPSKEGAVNGLMVGTASADLTGTKWLLTRGAIADNLTSLGGAFESAHQTKLTAFLSAGAAMSSGAVAEPYSLQYKFPTPMLYVYYAKGLSAIESFYQTVSSPYQLLIVGDPLAQPFAKAPDELIDVSFIEEGKRRLRIARRSLGLKIPKSRAATMELSIDDRIFQVVSLLSGVDLKTVEINWPDQTSGIYDVRATLTGVDRTEPRVTFLSQVDVAGPHAPPTLTMITPRNEADGFANDGSNASPIEVKLECMGADRIELHHLNEIVARIDSDSGHATIETKTLGGGPLRFRPVAFFGDTKVRGVTTTIDQVESDK